MALRFDGVSCPASVLSAGIFDVVWVAGGIGDLLA